MRTVLTTEIFDTWFSRLGDARAKARINARIRRAEEGNLGDCAPVGQGVSEMRIHHGPGYRIYFVQRGVFLDPDQGTGWSGRLIILLAGGDKSTQAKDIKTALGLAQDLKDGP
jgi:putative addiction module killer protein